MVDAALALADSEGLEALTIRRLAQALGVTPTALYWHFADKQAVLDALGDRLWQETLEELGPAKTHDAWDEIRAVFEAVVAVFRRHPALAHLAPPRFVDSSAGLTVTERTLELLACIGYDDRGAADAARFLVSTALMLVMSLPGVAIPDTKLREEIFRRKRAALLTLPPDRYPRMQRAAGYLFGPEDDPDPYYKFAVDLIIDGLRTGTGGSPTR